MADSDFLYRAAKAGLITRTELEVWGRDALSRIRGGYGKTLVAWSLAGNSYNTQITMTPEDLLSAISHAIESLKEEEQTGGAVTTLYATFSGS